MPRKKPRVVIAGMGDTGTLVATRLAKSFNVLAVSTKPALVSGQELGARLTNFNSWKKYYFVEFNRMKKLRQVELVHGRITGVSISEQVASIENYGGEVRQVPYDFLVLATGVSNGFWKSDAVAGVDEVLLDIQTVRERLEGSDRIAVVGGGATGTGVAHHLAKHGNKVDFYFSADLPLPGFHPRARKWAERELLGAGVNLHSHHRVDVPQGVSGREITQGTLTFETGEQSPYYASILWTLGRVRPHTDFLEKKFLDNSGFIKVDEKLRVEGCENVFALGDVAASDPLRSSARNWGWKIVVSNVKRSSRKKSLLTFRPKKFQWGSVFGLQDNGLIVVQPNGRRMRIVRSIAQRFIYDVYIKRYLYQGLSK